jgi:hypothetical protein
MAEFRPALLSLSGPLKINGLRGRAGVCKRVEFCTEQARLSDNVDFMGLIECLRSARNPPWPSRNGPEMTDGDDHEE